MGYHVEMAPAAYRLYKKFDKALQDKVREEAVAIAQDPFTCKELKPPFRGVRSYKFTFRGVSYRIAYHVDADRQVITVVLVHSRQNFYYLLRRVLRF